VRTELTSAEPADKPGPVEQGSIRDGKIKEGTI